MKAMDRSTQVSFGNFLLSKHGITEQVTAEDLQQFYDMTEGQKEAFVFPDDLDKIVPDPALVAAEEAPKKGARKVSLKAIVE